MTSSKSEASEPLDPVGPSSRWRHRQSCAWAIRVCNMYTVQVGAPTGRKWRWNEGGAHADEIVVAAIQQCPHISERVEGAVWG